MNKIRHYFSTLEITRGLGIALLSSAFIYLHHWGFSYPLLNTILGLSSLFLLLRACKVTWFWYGMGIGLFWFWWISLSLQHYGYAWGLPVGLLLITLLYGFMFLFLYWGIEKIASFFVGVGAPRPTLILLFKALALLGMSLLHPFGFDWFKPELMFVESYIGIEKWQFAMVLGAMVLSISQKNILFFFLVLFAYQPTFNDTNAEQESNNIALITTHVSVEDKWNTSTHMALFEELFQEIDKHIQSGKKLIILPESVFPVFLNQNPTLLAMLKQRSQKATIVTGGLYWDGTTPHNSTYIFDHGAMRIANKVLLVPFGESNPLPDFLSDWVNKVFYDGAIDYVASAEITDYTIDNTTYRNAICFEATSEKLYSKDKEGKRPEHMIILSNNGWFTPSIEPALQKLLLLYYHKKYGTVMYHVSNMSESYVID